MLICSERVADNALASHNSCIFAFRYRYLPDAFNLGRFSSLSTYYILCIWLRVFSFQNHCNSRFVLSLSRQQASKFLRDALHRNIQWMCIFSGSAFSAVTKLSQLFLGLNYYIEVILFTYLVDCKSFVLFLNSSTILLILVFSQSPRRTTWNLLSWGNW